MPSGLLQTARGVAREDGRGAGIGDSQDDVCRCLRDVEDRRMASPEHDEARRSSVYTWCICESGWSKRAPQSVADPASNRQAARLPRDQDGGMMLMNRVRGARDFLLTYRVGGRGPAGTPLPPPPFRMGGHNFETDHDFVLSAIREVDRLTDHGFSDASRLLDWGCGAGRLAVGLKENGGSPSAYHGVDVQKPLIQWAQRHLGDGRFHFMHVNSSNARYNPNGVIDRHIPGVDCSFDVIYAYSVFSHMTAVDVRTYLGEIRRLLRPGGFSFFTAFVEDDVEPEIENPPGYGGREWDGTLLCVRYDRQYFEKMICDANLALSHFDHGNETDGQSLYVVRPA